MFDHPILARQFDRVIVTIDPEHRKWNPLKCPCPDGTEGVIIGFYDAVLYAPRAGHPIYNGPGVYHQRGAAQVWLPDGQIYQTGTSELELADREEGKRRLEEFRALQKSDPAWDDKQRTRIGDLPELPFWEDDVLLSKHWGEVTVCRIDYHLLDKTRDNGSSFPVYGVRLKEGGQSAVNADEATLVSRGNVWKYYHHEPLSFAGIKEEAAFYDWIHRTQQLKNPRSGNYVWTKDEVLAAIKKGDAHMLKMSGSLFGSTPFPQAFRFLDEEVGARVARATLEGFNIAA